MSNIYENIPDDLKEEFFETILEDETLRVERIVSTGHSTPPGEWLDQKDDEWVILLSGEAELSFDDGAPNARMKPGDHIFIEAGRRHRVEWTDPAQKTVWLAVHRSVI